MKFLVIVVAALLLATACTISVTTVHTQGVASDVVDEDQKADADVSPDISIPALGDYDCGGRDVGFC